MDRWPFSAHSATWTYPKGDALKLGNGYTFVAKPQLPLQRNIHLHYDLMIWYRNDAGQLDATINPYLNMLAMMRFYEAHNTSDSFIYPSDIYGDVIVKFDPGSPFEIPKTAPGSLGVTQPFDVQLLEIPQ